MLGYKCEIDVLKCVWVNACGLQTHCRDIFFRLNKFKPWFIIIEIITTKLGHCKVTGFSKTVGFHVCAYNIDQVCWSVKSIVPGHLLLSQN